MKEFYPEKYSGGITLPAEAGEEAAVKELCRIWGADYIRDSDGTQLSPELLALGYKIYSTICIVRADQDWPRQHPDQLHQKFLMSDVTVATSNVHKIQPMSGFYAEKYQIDTVHDCHDYWQVFDRTTGLEVDKKDWSFDGKSATVTVANAKKWHLYTVNFLVYQIWDTTSMYNHLTNNWTTRHIMSTDPYNKKSYDHLMNYFEKWLIEHPDTDLVRLTTLAYHFAVDSNSVAGDKLRDWTGYQDTISIQALKDFEQKTGYKLCSEDFVDAGYYNNTTRVPSAKILDWMNFIHHFVVKFGKELCDKTHAANKTTGMFWGDHWIGAEPYLESFEEMGIDVHIGACEDGVALRRIADTPGKHVRECRLYPYFFPDVFKAGGDPLTESSVNWLKIRRALLRKCIDRIGYGGYLSLLKKFPEFVQHVSNICDEFRAIKNLNADGPSWMAPVKVAVLSAYGRRRSWIPMHGPAQKFMEIRPDAFWVAGSNLLECLAGLPVEVCFISCDEIAAHGVPDDVNVIINDGASETSWSGGSHWLNPELTTAVRKFVGEGGGFIGCRGPGACSGNGHYFQLFDVLGVEKEMGHSVQSSRINCRQNKRHFILDADFKEFDFGSFESWVYSISPDLAILSEKSNHIMLAANEYFGGRSVYFAGLPYSEKNSHLLYRAIMWSAKKEKLVDFISSSNINCEVAYYEKAQIATVVNNTNFPQETRIKIVQNIFELKLKAGEIKFIRSCE